MLIHYNTPLLVLSEAKIFCVRLSLNSHVCLIFIVYKMDMFL